MRRVLTFALAAMLAVAALPVLAQSSKPNFAGQWALVPDANAASGGMGMMAGDMTIAQNEKTVTITRSLPQFGDMKSVYNLDGSDSSNTLNLGGNDVTMVSKAKWDGSKLTIKTSFDVGGQSAETSMSLSLDGSGNLLVESTRPDFQGGGGPVTTKATYKKKS